jgi:(p)ppGpp synthase/HD superfamily hydrolase
MTDLVKRAKEFAKVHHAGQKYGGEFDYFAQHLQVTESVLLRFGIADEYLRCGAILHDVLEDTGATYEEVEMYFGDRVAKMVSALTEPKGGNRKWRHEQTYPRIRVNQDAIIVKLADRIANVEANGDKVGMYKKEHADFKKEVLNYCDTVVGKEMIGYLDELLIRMVVVKE